MNKSILERLAKPNFSTIVIGVIAAAALWLLPLFFVELPLSVSSTLWDGSIFLTLPGIVAYAIQFGLFLILAFLIQQLVERLQIYPERSFIPFFLFLLFGSSISQVQFFDSATIAFLLMLLSFYYLIKSYNVQKAQFSILNTAVALGCAALFHPIFVAFIPLFWVGLFKLRSFNIKSFLAFFFGLLLTAYTIAALYFISDGWNDLLFNLDTLYLFDVPRLDLSLLELTFAGVALALICFILFSMSSARSFSKLNIRNINGFFMLALFYTFVLVLFSPFNYHELIYIIFFITSVLFGFYFSTTNTKVATILFYFTLTTSVIYRCLSLFID